MPHARLLLPAKATYNVRKETMQRQRAACSMQLVKGARGNDPAARGVESTAVAHVSRYGVGRSHNSAVASVNSPPTAETSTQCRKVARPEPFPARRAAGHQQARHPDALELRPQGAALCHATHSTARWHAYPRGSRYRQCTSMPCESRPAVPRRWGSPVRGMPQEWARPFHICARTGLTPLRWLSGPGQPH